MTIIEARDKILAMMKLDDTWFHDGNDGKIAPPNKFTIDTAWKLVYKLITWYNISPGRIEPTVEEGVFMNFKNGDAEMYLEIYNDGDICYITYNVKTKETIDNQEIAEDGMMGAILMLYCVGE